MPKKKSTEKITEKSFTKNGKKYYEVELDLNDKEIAALAREAHKRDMKLNTYMVKLLKDWLNEHEKKTPKNRRMELKEIFTNA